MADEKNIKDTVLSAQLDAVDEYLDGDPRYDQACKNVLANRVILAKLLKYCVDEFKNCSEEDIAFKYIEGDIQVSLVNVHRDATGAIKKPSKITGMNTEDATITERKVFFDIRFSAVAPIKDKHIGLIINVESQYGYYPGYPIPKRSLYYCCRLVSAQYGTVFEKSEYGKIQKVYSIWICTDPPEHMKNTITSYSIEKTDMIGSVDEPKENYDIIKSVVICTGDKDTGDIELQRFLNLLFSTEAKTEEKKQRFEKEFNIKMTEELAEGVSEMCNISQGIAKNAYEKGAENEKVSLIKNLMTNMKWTVEQAFEALGIAASDYEKYKSLIARTK